MTARGRYLRLPAAVARYGRGSTSLLRRGMPALGAICPLHVLMLSATRRRG